MFTIYGNHFNLVTSLTARKVSNLSERYEKCLWIRLFIKCKGSTLHNSAKPSKLELIEQIYMYTVYIAHIRLVFREMGTRRWRAAVVAPEDQLFSPKYRTRILNEYRRCLNRKAAHLILLETLFFFRGFLKTTCTSFRISSFCHLTSINFCFSLLHKFCNTSCLLYSFIFLKGGCEYSVSICMSLKTSEVTGIWLKGFGHPQTEILRTRLIYIYIYTNVLC